MTPPVRLAEEMHALSTSAGRLAGTGGFLWLFLVLLPTFLVCLPLGLVGHASPWWAFPATLLLALYAAGLLLPSGWAHLVVYRLLLLLVVPFSVWTFWSQRGRLPKPGDASPTILGGANLGPAARALSALGNDLPWPGAAILDLYTGTLHTGSAHTRLAATTGADRARSAFADAPGRWLATDGQGLVVLADLHGRVLAWRRPRSKEHHLPARGSQKRSPLP